MKNVRSAILAAFMAVVLAACGSSVSEETKKAAEGFLGSWQLAKMMLDDDVTMWGDFSEMLGSEGGWTIEVSDDGNTHMQTGGQEVTLPWTLTDKGELSIEGGWRENETLVLSQDGNAITATWDSEDDTMELGLTKMQLWWTKDGTIEDVPAYNKDEATAITSADKLVGEWELVGGYQDKYSMYGSSEAVAALMGVDPALTFAEDNTGTLMGADMTWSADDNGAIIKTELAEGDVSVMAFGDDIVFDFGDGVTYRYAKK